MKKLVFMFVAFVSMTFAACGGQTQPTIETVDSATIDSIDSVVASIDSIVTDSVVTE